jgi:hypothetical protein
MADSNELNNGNMIRAKSFCKSAANRLRPRSEVRSACTGDTVTKDK